MNKSIITHKQSLMYIVLAFSLTLVLMLVNFAAAYISNSLALFADATHLLVHNSSLLIALVSSIISYKLAHKHSNKAKIVDIIGGVINSIIFLSIAFFIVSAGFERLDDHDEVHVDHIIMTITAVIGFIIHCLSAYILNKGKKHSFNIHAIFLHTFFDCLTTILTFIAGIVILFTGNTIVDSATSFIIVIFVTFSGVRLLKKCIKKALLLHKETSLINSINKSLTKNIKHISNIHAQEITWKTKNIPSSFSAHIVLNNSCLNHNHDEECLSQINELLKEEFSINESIIQIEHLS